MRKPRMKPMLVCVVAAIGSAWAVTAFAAETTQGDVYPLDKCIVSGQKFGAMGEPKIIEYEGREIRFCCAGCEPKFREDPAKYLKQIDAAIMEQQTPLYPLDTCLISGDKLGSRGEPVDYVYRNRLVRFCCKGCVAEFEKDTAKHLKKLDEAVIAKQKPAYPLDTCPVMGGKLGSTAVDYVSGNRLVRFCCPGCIETFRKDPAKYLKQVDEAALSKTKG